MANPVETGRMAPSLRRMLLPLALAQFICSFAGSNMNVMINDISQDLHTTVQGVQIAITLFLLVMAALMIPGGKLTDRWGRKRCFTMGLSIYAVGAVLSAARPRPGCPDPGELDPRRGGYRPPHSPRLHPHDHALPRPPVPGPGVRHHQRHGWDRCGHWSPDRGVHHHDHHLAGCLRLPSRRGRPHRPAQSPHPRSAAGRSHSPVRHRRGDPVGGWPGDTGRRNHGGRQQPCCVRAPHRRRGARHLRLLRLGPQSGTSREGGTALDEALSQPHLEPRDS